MVFSTPLSCHPSKTNRLHRRFNNNLGFSIAIKREVPRWDTDMIEEKTERKVAKSERRGLPLG
jgi:hypothetical protein